MVIDRQGMYYVAGKVSLGHILVFDMPLTLLLPLFFSGKIRAMVSTVQSNYAVAVPAPHVYVSCC